jgi:hypothetical protein
VQEIKVNCSLSPTRPQWQAILDSGAMATVADVMGGNDERLRENREHFAEREALATRFGVRDAVVFLRSISDAVNRALLDVCGGCVNAAA